MRRGFDLAKSKDPQMINSQPDLSATLTGPKSNIALPSSAGLGSAAGSEYPDKTLNNIDVLSDFSNFGGLLEEALNEGGTGASVPEVEVPALPVRQRLRDLPSAALLQPEDDHSGSKLPGDGSQLPQSKPLPVSGEAEGEEERRALMEPPQTRHLAQAPRDLKTATAMDDFVVDSDADEQIEQPQTWKPVSEAVAANPDQRIDQPDQIAARSGEQSKERRSAERVASDRRNLPQQAADVPLVKIDPRQVSQGASNLSKAPVSHAQADAIPKDARTAGLQGEVPTSPGDRYEIIAPTGRDIGGPVDGARTKDPGDNAKPTLSSTAGAQAHSPLLPQSALPQQSVGGVAHTLVQQTEMPLGSASEARPDSRLAAQVESAVQQIAVAREAGRGVRPEMLLRHGEFGLVNVRIEAAGGELRAHLSSRDPGFVPAIQSALAERMVSPALESSSSNLSRNSDQAGSQTPHSGFTGGNGHASDPRYGSSTGSGQGSSQPYFDKQDAEQVGSHSDAASSDVPSETKADQHSGLFA